MRQRPLTHSFTRVWLLNLLLSLPPLSLSGATTYRHMLDIHERRADAYIHKHLRPLCSGDVDGVGHNVRIRTAASLFPLSRRGSCRATPFFAYASPSRHLRRVVRVQSEERFLNLERRRRDRSPMRRGDHQRDQKRMQRADGRRRRRLLPHLTEISRVL